MHIAKTLGAGLFALSLAACGGGSSSTSPPTTSDFANATPDVAGLTLETTGAASESSALGASAQALEVAGQAVTAAVAPPACQPYQYLCNVHRSVYLLNTYVKAAVGPVEQLAQTTPTSTTGDLAVYGPVSVPATGTAIADFRLTVKRDGDSDHWKWKLEGKKTGSDPSTYATVMAGKLKKADRPHRGRGTLAIDLDKLNALEVDPAHPVLFVGKGQLLASFSHHGNAKSLVYGLKNFDANVTDDALTPDPTALTDGAFLVGWKNEDGTSRVRIADKGEFVTPASGTDAGLETLLARARWNPALGGRAAVVLTGGDVTSSGLVDYFLGVSCFDKAEGEVYRDLFFCKSGTCNPVPAANLPSPASEYRKADKSLCAPGTELFDETTPPSSTSGTDKSQESGAPDTNDPPPSSVSDVSF